jgi:hypothetical protein
VFVAPVAGCKATSVRRWVCAAVVVSHLAQVCRVRRRAAPRISLSAIPLLKSATPPCAPPPAAAYPSATTTMLPSLPPVSYLFVCLCRRCLPCGGCHLYRLMSLDTWAGPDLYLAQCCALCSSFWRP